MRKLSFVSCLLLLLSNVAYSQTLGELARKEKERRKKNEKSEKARIITEKELTETEGEINIVEELDPSLDDNEPLSATTPGSSSKKSNNSQWVSIRARYADAYLKQKKHLAFLRRFESFCKDGTPPPQMPSLTLINCEILPQDIAATEEQMKQIQESLREVARKMGIPPGQARLR
jgi:hypothetical protein